MLRKNITPLIALTLGLASLSCGIAIPAIAQTPSSFPDDATLAPTPTVPTSTPTAYTPSSQYIVYIANVNPAMMPQVKTIAPDAFVSHLDSGQKVLQIGRFNNLNLAQKKADQLRQAGLSPEVKPVSTKFASALPTVPSAVPTTVTRGTTPVAPSAIPTTLPSVPITPSIPSSIPTDPNNTGGMLPIANAQPIQIENSNTLPSVPTGIDPQQGGTVEINRSVQPIPVSPVPTTLPPTAAIDANPAPIPNQFRYFVIIPTTSYVVLQRAKMVSPNAQVRTSNRGPYIEVQGYPDRTGAEALNAAMRKQGFDSRVAFF
ncbi:hypothetical protein TUMEXPCC7403_11025 [Tumidithrix helvetica PCC 7403]|uniref:hypothetical protein n=1 Tax=Tumidithrix helvetica TaxID=3457545 RepID=UPI003C84F977